MFEDTEAFSGFAVDDLDKAREFYGETLGLTVSELDGLLGLKVAGSRDILIYPKPDHVPGHLHDPELPCGRHRRGGRRAGWPRSALRALRRLRPGREGHRPRRGSIHRLVQGSRGQRPVGAPGEGVRGGPGPSRRSPATIRWTLPFPGSLCFTRENGGSLAHHQL